MKNEHAPCTPRRRPGLIPAAALVCLLLLAGCSEKGLESVGGDDNDDGDDAIGNITAGNARVLTGSALDMIGKIAIVGNIANTLVQEHIDLLSGPERTAHDVTQCGGPYANETNRIDYREIAPGFRMPPGPSLHIALSQCTIESVAVSGFIDITAIDYESSGSDWQIDAEIFLNPVEILNDNGTQASLTDHMRYTATMEDGVLTTTLQISADANLGIIGGLNAQHYVAPINAGTRFVNYQFRPFRIHSIENPHTGEYRVAIEAHAEGASRLIRYTGSADPEIILQIATTAGLPVLWQGGRPAHYEEVPASGEISLAETCTGCGSILATINSSGVILTVTAEGGVVTEELPWATLIAPPGAP